MSTSSASATHRPKPMEPPANPRLPLLASLIEKHANGDGIHETAVPRLFLLRASQPTAPLHVLHEPALCLVAQGRKQMMLAEETYLYGPEQCLIITVDVPVVAQVIEAAPTQPYLCVRLNLDLPQLSALMMETPRNVTPTKLGTGVTLATTEPPLLEAMIRMLQLLDAPHDIAILAPLIEREILYRLLSGEQGARLRQIALADQRIESITRAIQWLRRNYAEPFRIETIAREAHMSPSALHHHFKAVTALSPLQYQKQIRLQEARRLMLGQALDAATASQSVGYESPSQFSREYSRLFGAPPSRDIARLKSEMSYTR